MDNITDSGIVDAEIVPEQPVQDSHRLRLRWALIGIGVLAFFALGAFVIVTGLQEDADKVADMVRDHPIVIEQLGGIDECKYNTFASLNEGGKRTDVFNVRGPKGSGQFVTFEFFYEFRSIILRTEAGEWELLDDADEDDDDDDDDDEI